MFFLSETPAALTGLDDSWLVAGADRQNFEHACRGPQQLLVRVRAHDAHQQARSTARQDDQLKR